MRGTLPCAVRTFIARPGAALAFVLVLASAASAAQSTSINGHPVVRDGQQKIVTWMTPADTAFDRFLDQRWNFIKTRVPMSPGPAPRSSYPQYYFYNGYPTTSSTIQPDTWMNDVGEKVPNWFENARLYYAYTGDASVMQIAGGLVDYALAHGTSPSTYSWPNFPYTTTNAGDTEFRGFTSAGRFVLHEIQVDHAAEMGLTYYRMYLYTGDARYLTAARNVADVLAAKARTGTATQSVWPYRVVMSTGQITSQYGANWIGAYTLLDALVRAGIGNVAAYASARDKARAFILSYPMVTGYWTDGHSDNAINSNTYRSNLSKSNAALYMLDNPEFDPNWRTRIPQLIQWTETYFVNRTVGGEPATDWGANIVGEQDDFNYKMDYQTARYAAENAKWYAASGDAAAKEKAFRSLSWVTYTNDANGRATESPYSLSIATWWSDCYGEGPRMFYHAFAAVPEWAPPGEDHILYSQGVLRNVSYAAGQVKYTPTEADDIEYLRLSFAPTAVTVGGVALSEVPDLSTEGYTVRSLGGGDYAVNVRRMRSGAVVVSAGTVAPAAPTGLSAAPGNGLVSLTWNASAAPGLAGYNLYRSTTSPVSTNGTPLNGGTPLTATSYTDSGLVNGTPYYYAITAVGTSGGQSAPSDEASATPEASAGAALAFDGTNDFVTFGVASALGVSEFTVEVWFKRTGPGVGVTTDATQGIPSAVPLVTKGRVEAEGSNRDLNFFLGINVANGVLVADFEDTAGGMNHPVYGATAVTPNVWHHAAATYDGSTWKLYLDGALDASLTLAGNPTPRNDSIQHAGLATAMTSAGVTGAAGYFQGVLDEARIWDYARSLGELQATLNLEIPYPYGGLVGRWGLDEGSGLAASDSSGSGVAGTLTNGPVWVAGRPFTADATPPAIPQNLVATAGAGLVSLTWAANTESDLAGYNVYRDGAQVNGSPVTAAAYVDNGLTSGQAYSYTVTAMDFGGLESDPSAPASATPVQASLSVGDLTVTEGSSGTTNATFTVTLSPAASGTVTVNYATANGTATAGTDYTATSGTLTFAAGQTSKTVAVPVLGDTAIEADETLTFNLSSASGAAVSRATATATITNDDIPTLSINDVTVTEGNAGTVAAVFTATLSAASSQAVTVNFATANGTATAGSDYVAQSGNLSFTAGQTTKTVSVTVNGDTAVEPNETFVVNLTAPSGATLADAQGQGTITNDDTAVTLPTLSINDVTVTEGNSGTTTANFTVTLSAASASTVTASFATANGTAAAGSDYVAQTGTLSFTAGQTTRPISITVNGDTTVEANETFVVNLSSPSGATLADAQGQGTITNDDSTPPPSGTEPVVWTSVVGASASGNTLTKTAAWSWSNAGAVSTQSVVSGDGYVEFTAPQLSYELMAGLGNGDASQSYVDVEYAIYARYGELQVYEAGTSRGSFGTYLAGDRLRVGVESGVVKYRKNDVVFYQSAICADLSAPPGHVAGLDRRHRRQRPHHPDPAAARRRARGLDLDSRGVCLRQQPDEDGSVVVEQRGRRLDADRRVRRRIRRVHGTAVVV